MQKSLSSRLKGFMLSQSLVRFSRRFEKHTVRGYVLDVGPQFFLLALVSDRIWYDGFECFRISDVSKLRPDPYGPFVEQALRARGEKWPGKPRISLKNIQELVLTAGRAFPLVAIHREKIDPDVCWIGRVVEVTPKIVRILELGPDAVWETRPEEYLLKEITHVNFGGDYENALYLVSGDPTEHRMPKPRRTRIKADQV
jgi:hypothetical protein